MSNIKFVIHLFVLLLLQLTILDNIQLHSYVYINIYILAIYILPYRLRNATILFFGFFLGLFVDLANHTMGIHAAGNDFIGLYSSPFVDADFKPGTDRRYSGKTENQ